MGVQRIGLETRTNADYRYVVGQLRRSTKAISIRGLNKDHNDDPKGLFKGAATMAGVRPSSFVDLFEAGVLPLRT
jgi:hypothetical protein